MNSLQSRHTEPEGTPVNSVSSSPSPIRMLVTLTLLTTSQDHTTIIPPITPNTIIMDPHAHMDRLEQMMRQMRGFKGTIP